MTNPEIVILSSVSKSFKGYLASLKLTNYILPMLVTVIVLKAATLLKEIRKQGPRFSAFSPKSLQMKTSYSF